MFNVGDKVRYIGKDYEFNKTETEGTIVEHVNGAITSNSFALDYPYWVKFKVTMGVDTYCCSEDELELIDNG